MNEEKSPFEQFMDDPYMDSISNPYGTDEERKQRNKEANIAACNKRFPWSIGFDGGLKQICIKCGYYRECDECRYEKFEAIEKRIICAQAILEFGHRLLFDRISHSDKEAYTKQIWRKDADYLSLPQPNEEYIIIHSWLDGEGEELWEVGYDDIDLYNEDNGMDLNFYTILKNIPEGKRISGNLGKPAEEEPEGNGGEQPEEEEEKINIKKPFIYKASLSERDAHHAYKLAVEKTLDINVLDASDLEKAMFARINAMAEHIKDAIIGFNWDAVSQEDIDLWNKNPNNKATPKTDNVRITTSSNNTSDYPDINHKKSSFEALTERANRGDDLDDMRQQAIQDYLEYHGT